MIGGGLFYFIELISGMEYSLCQLKNQSTDGILKMYIYAYHVDPAGRSENMIHTGRSIE